MKPLRIYRHKYHLAFGIGAEAVGIFDEKDNTRYRIMHLKIDFFIWSIHWDFRYTSKTPL